MSLDVGVLKLKTEVDSSGIEKMSGTMTNVGKIASDVMKKVVQAGAEAVKAFGEVDSTMRLTASTMGATQEEADKMWKTMSDTAETSIYTMGDASEAMLNFARAGLDATEASNALAPSMHLAAGEGGDLNTVSKGLVATINGFGDSFDKTSHYADVFAAACNNSALDVDSLSSSMSTAVPIFATAGWDVEDLATAMGLMGNKGIEANRSATALKTGIQKLISPTKDAQMLFDEWQIELTNADGTLKDFPEVIDILREAFLNLSDAEQIQAASTIFGKNQAANMLALIQTSKDDYDDLADSIKNCAGVSDDMADTMMEGMGGKMEQLNSTLDVAKVKWGELLSEGLLPLMDPLIETAGAFGDLAEIMGNLHDISANFSQTWVGQVLDVINSTLNPLEMTKDAFQGLGMDVLPAVAQATEWLNQKLDPEQRMLAEMQPQLAGVMDSYQPMPELLNQVAAATGTVTDSQSSGISVAENYAAALSAQDENGDSIYKDYYENMEKAAVATLNLVTAQEKVDASKVIDEYSELIDQQSEYVANTEEVLNRVEETYARVMEDASPEAVHRLTETLMQMENDHPGILADMNTMTDKEFEEMIRQIDETAEQEEENQERIKKAWTETDQEVGLKLQSLEDKFNDVTQNDPSGKLAQSLVSGLQSEFGAFRSQVEAYIQEANRLNSINMSSGAYYGSGGRYSYYYSHKTGLDYVPYDGYMAQLHLGERVLTRSENEEYTHGDGTGSGPTVINNYEITVPQNDNALETALRIRELTRNNEYGFE